MTDSERTSWDALRALVGDVDRAELRRLMDVFLASAAASIERAHAALERRDMAEMCMAAHTLRSASAAVAADRLAALAEQLECATRRLLEAGRTHLAARERAGLGQVLASLDAELDAFRARLDT